jgi:UrcA family protein
MKKRVITGVFVASLIALGLPSAASASAPSEFGNGSIQVAYGDLDLTTAAGAKTLYARLQRASEVACDLRSYRELGSIGLHRESLSCYEKTLTGAVERIDSDELTKLHTSG